MHIVVRNFAVWFFILCALTGCTSMPAKQKIPTANTEHTIYFIYREWHTSILIDAKTVAQHSRYLQQEAANQRYIRIGWGDGNYFTGKRKTFGSATKALIASSHSALQVIAYAQFPFASIPPQTRVPIAITDKGMRKLIRYLDKSFALDEAGRAPAAAVRMSGSASSDGIIKGYKSRFLVDGDGQVAETRSISAGLDYPGIGPELASLGESGRIEFVSVRDEDALSALRLFARTEGVLFALESAHAGAAALKAACSAPKDKAIVVNMSGRGDKDIFITSPVFRPSQWKEFLKAELERLETGQDVHLFGGST